MKWHIASVILLVVSLTACDQNAGSERGKITPSARNGTASMNMAGKDCKIFVEGSKEKYSKDKGCLDLVALQKCLVVDDDQVARASTVDIEIFKESADLNKLELLNDQKLLAQVLNERDELKVTYETKRLKDFRSKFDGLNAVQQKRCEFVTLQNESGKLEQYTIEFSDSKRPRISLSSISGADGLKVIEVYPGRIVVRTFRQVNEVNRCGESKSILAKTTQELVYGGNSRGQVRVGYAFAKLIAENSKSSETLKQAVKASTGIESKNQKSKERNAQNQILINEAVFADAVSQLNKGQFVNLECPNK